MQQAGYNVVPATKGQGSVGAGISFCQSLRIHSKRENVNLNSEQATYKWREDKDGMLLDEPVKFADHALDAMRYALMAHLNEGFGVVGVTGGDDVYPG
jgi:phage terminase large subunit